MVRLNFSHGLPSDHANFVNQVRAWSKDNHKPIGIIADLQGPKIRISGFQQGTVVLVRGQAFTLDSALGKNAGDAQRVGLIYPDLWQDVSAGDVLFLDDGKINLPVLLSEEGCISTKVLVGGALSSNKGVNLQGGGILPMHYPTKTKRILSTPLA